MSANTAHELADPRIASTERNRGRGSSLAWFAGIPSGALVREGCDTGLPFYNALGLAVLMSAVLSAVTLTIALGYVLHESAVSLWPIGLVWGALILNIDRLLQMVTVSKHMFLATLPRVIVSLVIGLLISEPLVLRLNQPEIRTYLQAQAQQAIQTTTNRIDNFYDPKIKADQGRITSIRETEHRLTAAVIQDSYLASCEAGEIRCSITHELGCGPVCEHYRQLATAVQAQLNSELPGDSATIDQLQIEIQRLQADAANQVESSTSSIMAGNGFIAREEALAALMAHHRAVLYEVWLLRIAIWLLDLLPLGLKVLHVTTGTAPYEQVKCARSRQEAIRSHRIDVEANVEWARIDEQGVADTEVNRVSIQADRDRRIAELERQWGPFTTTTGSSADRINAMSLSDLTRNWKGHHQTPVRMPSALPAAGWSGAALIAALAVLLGVVTYYGHRVLPGEWLAFLALPIALSLAAFTKGFREAPGWALKATFAELLVGLALPVVVVILNL